MINFDSGRLSHEDDAAVDKVLNKLAALLVKSNLRGISLLSTESSDMDKFMWLVNVRRIQFPKVWIYVPPSFKKCMTI